MELSRTEYPAMLESLSPVQACNLLSERVRLIKEVHISVADWLQERRKVEEAYVHGLRKLARRPQLDAASALGIFQLPWQRLVNATEELATSHEAFATGVDLDVTQPLRDYASTDTDLQQLQSAHADLSSLARDLETCQRRLEKLRTDTTKKNAAPKIESAETQLTELSAAWQSRAPFVFEKLQAVDEHRLNALRDTLTQYQTHEVDQNERTRQAAEGCLNVLLNVETGDEIKTFAVRATGEAGGVEGLAVPVSALAAGGEQRPASRQAQQQQGHGHGHTHSHHLFGSVSGGTDRPASPMQRRPTTTDDGFRDSGAPLPTPPPKPESKSAFGGLRRLGTKMTRRKSVVPPPPPHHGDDASSALEAGAGSGAGTGKKFRNSFMPFRRTGTSEGKHSHGHASPEKEKEKQREQPESSMLREDEEEFQSPPPSQAQQLRERDDGRQSAFLEEVGVGTSGAGASAVAGTDDWFSSINAGGGAGAQDATRRDSILELPEPSQGQQLGMGMGMGMGLQQPVPALQPQQQGQQQQQQQQQVDAEGFTVRPDAVDEITAVQRENAGHHDVDEHALRIRERKIEEDEAAAKAAMDQMANTLRLQAQQSGGLQRSGGTVRGRREQRATVFGPSASSPVIPPEPPAHNHGRPELSVNVGGASQFPATAANAPNSATMNTSVPSLGSASPISPMNFQQQAQGQHQHPPRTMASISDEHDAGSIYSSNTMQSGSIATPSGQGAHAASAFTHPDLHEPGLNASIVETVTCRQQDGKVVSSAVIGQVAFAYNPASPSSLSSSSDLTGELRIRLENFGQLEKIAANPALASAGAVAGEYKLNKSAIASRAAQTAFKHSVRQDGDGNSGSGSGALGSYCPVLFEPKWQLTENQASAVVYYSANPGFVGGVPDEGFTLTNVHVTVNLDTTPAEAGEEGQTPTRAISAIMYPNQGAKFRQRSSSVSWKLGSLSVPATGHGKLLVRFGTAGNGAGPKPGVVDAAFELRCEGQSMGVGVSVLEEKERDPFADEETGAGEEAWREVPTKRVLKGVKYVAA